MATQNRNDAPEGRDQTQRQQAGAAMPAGETTGPSGRSQGVSRSDQERQRQVSREPWGQSAQRGTGLSRRSAQSRSALPAIMSAPPGLLAGAFMSNPFEFMRRLNSEMDRLFESNLGGSGELESSGTATTWMPRIEKVQRDNQLVIRAELPGLNKDDVTINVDEGLLEISGERHQEDENKDDESYWTERSYGSFYRAIPLPDGVDEDKISANFDNGILNVTVPVPPQHQHKAKRVQIK